MENNALHDAVALTGRQQAFAMIASKCTYAQAVCLKEIHETRGYEQLGVTWEQYCSQYCGIGRTAAENIIRRLDEFGEAYFRFSALVRISPDAFRQITADNAAKIRAGIRRLQDDVRRLNNHYRVPTRVLELGIRADDIFTAISSRARLGRALPHDEAAGIRSLARHSITKWTEIEEMLKPPHSDS
jgi:hypothetical protein